MAELVLATVTENSKEALLRKIRLTFTLEVEKRVRDVQEKLRLWLHVLKYLDAKKGKDSCVHDLESDIRDLVCRLQDVHETYSNIVHSRRCGSIQNYLRKLPENFQSFRMVNLEVEKINTRITKSIEVLKCSNILQVTDIEERSHLVNENPESENGQKFRYGNTLSGEQHIVGMDDELETLKSNLVDGEHRVICLYGMGGIGKTTLAKRLYSDTFDGDRFDISDWVNMGQNITMENVLNQLSGGADKAKNPGQELETLAEHVKESLKGKRYLVVLDDIWSLDGWDFLRNIFPDSGKLILTTRLREVASYVAGDDRDGLIHVMRFLSISESSELFRKTAFFGEPGKADLFKQKEEEVLKVCQGLPSAIIAVGEILAKKQSLSEWEIVLQYTKSLISRGLPVDQIGLEQSISALSFDDLPYHLKQCFLYLGLFPKGSKIEVEHLYLLWMAEGIISLADCQNKETMVDLAERYLSRLVQRKMVEVEEEIPSLRKYKSCWVHEDMQDHCLLKGEGYFFKVLDFARRTQRTDSESSSTTSNPARRMALHLGNQADRSSVDQFRNEKVNYLRSLLLLNENDHQMKLEWPWRMFYLKKYRRLRVLSFERFDFQERGLPRGTTTLIYLRYLSFKGCILGVLPSSIGNLSFLKTLDLRVSDQIIITIPNILRKMEKLVYLYLPLKFQTPNNDKLYLRSLKELEILENFDTRMCDVDDLFEMMKLRHLSTSVEGILLDLEQIVRRMDMTSEHGSVFYPSITVKKFDCYTEERHSAFRKLLNCQILRTLYMDGHLGQLPPPNKITSSLTKMVLIGSQLKEDPMTTLDKLPKLQVLVLEDNAFDGKKMMCVKSSFKQLKHLKLKTLHFLETWEVEEESMPMLSILSVEKCRKLRTLPHELRNRVPSVTFENDN